MGKVVKGVGNAIGGAAHAVGGAANRVGRAVGLNGGNLLGTMFAGPAGLVLGGTIQDATDGSGRGIGRALLNNLGRGGAIAGAGLAGAGLAGLAGGAGGLSLPSLGGIGTALGRAGDFLGSPLGQGLTSLGLGALAGATNAFTPSITQTQNAATPTAGHYSQFLDSMMGSQSGAQNAIQNMLQGQIGDPSSLQDYFGAGMGGSGQADLSGMDYGINPINVGYTPGNLNLTQPGFAGANLQQAGQYDPMQVTALQQMFSNPQLNNINLQNIGREQLATGPNTMLGFGGQANLGSVVNPEANVAALQQVMGGQQQRDIADLRERFGNQALSTGAQQAEALYRAEAAPRTALAIDDIMRQNQAQQLTQRGQDLMAWQTGRGMDIQQLGLGADQANALNQALIQQRGQDVQQAGTGAQVGLSGNDQVLQLANMQNQFGLQGGAQNLQAQLANQQAGLNAAGLNNQALNDFNQLNLQQAGQQNQFNQQNMNNLLQQFMANQQAQQVGGQQGLQAGQLNNQFGLDAAQLMQSGLLQNQQMGNQWNLGLQNIGLGQQNNQLQAQQAALQQLFGGWNNMANLGLAGAENVINPSTGAQVAGGIGAAGSLFDIFNQARGMGGGANLNGGNFANPQLMNLPNFQLPQVSQLPNLGGMNPLMMPQLMGGR